MRHVDSYTPRDPHDPEYDPINEVEAEANALAADAIKLALVFVVGLIWGAML